MKNSANLLQVVDIAVGYEGHCILQGLNLTVVDGEIVALLGPNAGGKTTFLRTLAGVLPLVQGEVYFRQKQLSDLSLIERAKIVAYVPQEIHSPAGYTVAETVAQARFAFGNESFAAVRVAVDEALNRTDTIHLKDRDFSELSGGEKRRVAIARALAQEAQLLLLDEPNAHLDLQHQRELAQLLRSLANEGLAAIVAVHDLDWASQLGARPFILVGDSGQAYESLARADELGALRKAYGGDVVRLRDEAGHERWLAER
ncbi:MAG: ABC transporter ATP-binding protein [Fimbriimonadaceae bacterium]|nr:ABC transporter ATP-binding protein [Fimbriimonadaceae bacterium]